MIRFIVLLGALLGIFGLLCMLFSWPLLCTAARMGCDGWCDFFCWLFDIGVNMAFVGCVLLMLSFLACCAP